MIFTSFLGTGKYVNCNYIYEKQRCENVTFIQTAIRTLFARNAKKNLIFVTEESEKINLPDLQKEAANKELPPMTPVRIPEGASEEQLWEIFQTLSEEISEGEEIIFDVTHALRSLPILMTILINYLNVVKKASLKNCYYGAFEKLGHPQEVRKIPIIERDAPIFNITPFFDLNTWTRAIDDFTRYGHAELLKEMIENETSPIFRKNAEKGKKFAITIKQAVRAIDDFSCHLHTSNLHELSKMNIQKNIIDRLASLKNIQNSISSLAPILKPLENIHSFFSDYEDHSHRNGLRAARDCARLYLIPQGFTILQETIVSLELATHQKALEKDGITDNLKQRQFISSLLGISPKKRPEEWTGLLEKHRKLAESIHTAWQHDFLENYHSITYYRNRLNHGGTNPNSRIKSRITGKELGEKAEKMLQYYLQTPA